ncbi:hypothetical protein A6046_06985 [[Haemophilus] ducreyi]|uniref:Sulphatase n=2 Tax=Haemophilus ducreyi TaxID=730 RepID=Q7VLE2_HAEDU|nr:DUF3413 domain-containing protein [[Haemophilus] ducreyi]AAP96306.1 putative sulphatase [[Haemophilus] ducreyi 35000HP]AKO31242.1 membrane protein [[Haemophilus] ducreyi]AKO32690.1 membrane protein [[Haemophilus] ducreyi]AKO34139.1 membrane protein [[Haemophilus] ducreyi]AKO35583.1 membrane protein [[Haemophilus] ducreyi]
MFKPLRQLLPTYSRQYKEEISQRITWGHWFTLFNVVLALCISTRYAFNADWPNTLSGKLYFFTSLFGHFSFIVFAAYLLLLFPLSFIIKNERTFRGLSVIIATIGQTVLLVDTEVFKQFYLHLSPLVWDLLVTPDDNSELSHQWQLLFVPMPIILLAQMLYSRWCWQKLRSFSRQKWGKFVALFFVACFTATHLIYAWADMRLYRPITSQKANYPLSHPMTARNFLAKHGVINRTKLQLNIAENGRLDSFYLNYPKQHLTFNRKPYTNVLIVNMSGLANEMIVAEKMPHLTQISEKTYRFMNHYGSGDSNAANLLGIFYSLSGQYLDSMLANKQTSPLLTAFKQANYQFGLFSHNSFAAPIYQQSIFAGFSLPKIKGNAQAIEKWTAWLNQRLAKPFFSYLDLAMPRTHNSLAPLEHVDAQFNQIWYALQQHNLLMNTLVIITADQANPTTEMNFTKRHLQVPMMIYWQGENQKINVLSSHLDLLPTLLMQLFAVNNPINDYAQGVNLTSPNERIWALASNHKWTVAIMPNGEQYHLDKFGHFEKYNANGEKVQTKRPPLALFLQMIKQSNQFVEK